MARELDAPLFWRASRRLPVHKLRAPIREVARYWPAWYLILVVQGMQSTALAQTNRLPPLLLLLAPLIPVALYYYARIRADAGIAHKGRSYVVFALVAGAILTSTFLPGGNLPMSRDTMLWWDEATTVVSVALLAIHCYCTQGRTSTLQFFVVALLYGCLLETAGVTLGFFQEPGYHFYVPGWPAPVATMLGWSAVFYTTTEMVRMLRPHMPAWAGGVVGAACGATVAGLMLDLQIDPVATAVGLWAWNPALAREPALAGVPLVNFAAWVGACLAFALSYYWVERHTHWAARQRIGVLALLIPANLLAGGVITLGVMALVAGPASPSVALLRDSFKGLLTLIGLG